MLWDRYGSALLSAYITSALTTRRNNDKVDDNVKAISSSSPLSSRLQSIYKRGNNNDDATLFTVVELGSGAVGMAGLCLAWSLKHYAAARTRARIILTDYEPHVLRQLQRNVDQNAHLWRSSLAATTTCDEDATKTNNVNVDVKFLDWGRPPADWHDYLGLSNRNDTIDLIVGSELVYTPENAAACRDCVLSLTARFPAALVCIIQIVDRPGWANIFVPGLREVAGLYVREESVDVDCDAAASVMMKRGGSLDRFDFGICYISRKEF